MTAIYRSIMVITGLLERHGPASLPKAILTGGTFFETGLGSST
jgi:hypothetical protein